MLQDGDGGGAFDMADMQAVREAYEERIAQLEQAHAAQRAADARLRQELIEDLTVELAVAREEGEVRVLEERQRRVNAEAQLMMVRSRVQRIDDEAAGVRVMLDAFLEPAPAQVVAVAAEPVASFVDPAPEALVRRKIRVR